MFLITLHTWFNLQHFFKAILFLFINMESFVISIWKSNTFIDRHSFKIACVSCDSLSHSSVCPYIFWVMADSLSFMVSIPKFLSYKSNLDEEKYQIEIFEYCNQERYSLQIIFSNISWSGLFDASKFLSIWASSSLEDV